MTKQTPRSNRSRATQARRRGKTKLGGGSIDLSTRMRAGVLGSNGEAKSLSRIPKAWAEVHRKVDVRPTPIVHQQWAKLCASVRPLVMHVGHTKTIKAIEWRGPPCLFDECVATPRIAIGRRLHWPVGSLPEYRAAAVRPRTAQQMAIDRMVEDWRGRQQLVYLEAIGVTL